MVQRLRLRVGVLCSLAQLWCLETELEQNSALKFTTGCWDEPQICLGSWGKFSLFCNLKKHILEKMCTENWISTSHKYTKLEELRAFLLVAAEERKGDDSFIACVHVSVSKFLMEHWTNLKRDDGCHWPEKKNNNKKNKLSTVQSILQILSKETVLLIANTHGAQIVPDICLKYRHLGSSELSVTSDCTCCRMADNIHFFKGC